MNYYEKDTPLGSQKKKKKNTTLISENYQNRPEFFIAFFIPLYSIYRDIIFAYTVLDNFPLRKKKYYPVYNQCLGFVVFLKI